jgi:5-methyltetrahydrofolate--homocysteine methyltransferase
MAEIIQDIYQCIVDGDHKGSAAKVQQALDQGLGPEVILNDALIAAMGEVGKLFEEGEYFVPEMLVSARAMQNGLNILKPALVKADVKPIGKVVIGTVQGDLHDIGKNLVCMMLEGAAFEIIDLGKDIPPEIFVEAVRENGAQIVAMSALLTTTMSNMQNTIEKLKAAGLRDKVKVMVGGAPVTQQYADHIGADGYAQDASKAVALAKSLLAVK